MNCDELKKFDQMGFIIGKSKVLRHVVGDNWQSYAAFRYSGSSLDFIQNDTEMPFEMKTESIIIRDQGTVWPLSGQNERYLAATYDERDFAIVYLIQESDDIYLYILNVYNLETERHYMMSELNLGIQSYVGFFQMYDSKNNSRKTFAIFALSGSNTELIREFQPLHNDSALGQTGQHFIKQVFIDHRLDYSNK